jgi:hypothetical protein
MSRRATSSDINAVRRDLGIRRRGRARGLLRQAGAVLLVGAAAYALTQLAGRRLAEGALGGAGAVAAGVADAVRTAAVALYGNIPVR